MDVIEARFEDVDLFSPRFQRNNKKGGLKNLRCFPTCSALHREVCFFSLDSKQQQLTPPLDMQRGFCGRMVVLNITPPPQQQQPFVAFGEFISYGAPRSGAADGSNRQQVLAQQQSVVLSLGDTVHLDKLRELCRDKLNPTKPFMEAERIDDNAEGREQRFAFNRDKKGWHYGWASNKHTCNASHVLQAYLFTEEASGMLKVCGIYQTPHFTLFCRRRRRFAMVPTAPIAPPIGKRIPPAAAGRKRQRTAPESENDDDYDDEDDNSYISNDNAPSSVTVSTQVERVDKMLRAISHRISHSNLEYKHPPRVAARTTPPDFLDQFQFSQDLFECIDFFAEDTLMLEVAEFHLQQQPHAPPNAQLVDDLIAFLFEEPEFTKSLNDFLQLASHQHFPAFVTLMSDHLIRFLELKHMSLQEFDQLFPARASSAPTTTMENLAHTTFQHISQALQDDVEAVENIQYDPELVSVWPELDKMQGVWIQAEPLVESPQSNSSAGEDTIETLRESMGYPWVLRKMLRFMEEKFEVKCENQVLLVRLQRKLFSSGAMKIVLDGEEHVWGMKLPLFEGISSAWKYRAWVDDEGVVHHVHDTGGNSNARMRRTMWVDDNDLLIIDVSLEEFNPLTKDWKVVAHALQRAKRC